MIIPAEKILNINLTYITKSEKIINYLALILIISNLTILLILMFNPLNVFLKNTTLLGDIIGRFWLFIDWILIATLFDTFVNSNKRTDINQSRLGLLFLIFIISIIIYVFFY
jgi:hypothetical protein